MKELAFRQFLHTSDEGGSRISFCPMKNNPQHERIEFIRELCKHRTEEEILEAEENFRNYLWLIKRICERLEQEEDLTE